MARVARTDEFKRQVVKDRLRGIPVKALCEKYSGLIKRIDNKIREIDNNLKPETGKLAKIILKGRGKNSKEIGTIGIIKSVFIIKII